MNEVVRSNNEGVSKLLEGDDKAAETSFKNSIATLKRISCLTRDSVPTMNRSEENGQSSEIESQNSCTDSTTNFSGTDYCQIIDTFLPLQPLQNEKNFIYRNLITLRILNGNEASTRSLRDILQIYSACVILNLALLSHMRFNLNRDSTSYYEKAEQTYKGIHKLTICRDRGTSIRDNISLLLRMVAANNLSLLRFEQGNHAAAREDLKVVAVLLNSHYTETSMGTLLDEEQINGFFSNVMLLLMAQDTARAA